ncbi:hypothetical protein ZTR_09183 [Talaromyces verruculosus]|nr:hypothetical protein ZTR_09183 [Talaromyces verruculosus]
MNRIFGYTKSTGLPEQENATSRSLPALWYRSDAMYQLERRAIFSKNWIVVSHQLRLAEPGQYIQLQEAGFAFFLVKDRQGNINGFHNVCRHRAYPLVQEKEGKKPSISWEDDFSGVDEQPRMQQFDLSDFQFDHQWEMVGQYNWKTLVDNYNEGLQCYHCPTGHPNIMNYSDLSKYWVETKGGHIQHFNTDRPDRKGMGIHSSFYFPNASITVSKHFFYLMRCIPKSASQTLMEYEVYRNKNSSDEEFGHLDSIFKQVLKEDKDLCNAAQENLNAGIYTNGQLHPHNEKGPLYFQDRVKEQVMSHRALEKEQRRDIWPATPAPVVTQKFQEEIDFCNTLDLLKFNQFSIALP